MMGLSLNSSSRHKKMRSEVKLFGPGGLVCLIITVNYQKVVFDLLSSVVPKGFHQVSQ